VTELLKDGSDAIILEDPNDLEALTAVLERLRSDRSLRQALAERARDTARRYTWDEVARRTIDVYRGLVGRGDG
jgi:glycosyltransferase involved in cell wall biosynthesis